MKRLFAMLMACALLLTSVTALAAVEPPEKFPNATYTATATKTPIVIDGVMDEAYENAEVIKIDSKIMVDLLYDEDEIALGEMRLLWDAEAIYAFITIYDATYAPAYLNTTWFNNVDSVWLAVGASDDLSLTNCYAVPRCGEAYNKMNPDSPDLTFVAKNMKDGREVAMGTYGNAEGNYPANAPKPEGDVDSYVLEIRIPYTGAVSGGSGWFGAFLCDDVDFANVDVINMVDGRARTSEAVSTPNDNGIWNTTGAVADGKVDDAREFFDQLLFK